MGGLDKFAPAKRYELTSCYAAYLYPVYDSDGNVDQEYAGILEYGDDGEDKEHERKSKDDVYEPRYDVIRKTASVTGYCAKRYADKERDHCGKDAYLEGYSCAEKHPAEDIPPVKICTHEVLGTRSR